MASTPDSSITITDNTTRWTFKGEGLVPFSQIAPGGFFALRTTPGVETVYRKRDEGENLDTRFTDGVKEDVTFGPDTVVKRLLFYAAVPIPQPRKPLDTRKLQALCAAVVRDAKGYNEGTIPKAQDEDWTRLTYESLPALEAFLNINPA